MITTDKLKMYAEKLMFNMKEEEYETLEKEFEVLIKQMDLIGEIEGIENVQPMTFPFEQELSFFREDETTHTISIEEALQNSDSIKEREIKVPKVVE